MTDVDTLLTIQRANLSTSIRTAFADTDAAQLRRWYVETFVMVPENLDLYHGCMLPSVLRTMLVNDSFPTVEHQAIGHRLIWEIEPNLIANPPDILNPGVWGEELFLVQTFLHVFRPWESMRYDPESENWYRRVHPGQWLRHGKGAPGQGAVEHYINARLIKMNHETSIEMFDPWPLDQDRLAKMGSDSATACLSASASASRKFASKSMSPIKIRKLLEQNPIMYLDSSTLNHIHQIAPFANGAVVLNRNDFKDVTGIVHTQIPGQLLPLDPEYMVTNANSLTWVDTDRRIPHAVVHYEASGGDAVHLDEYEDHLWTLVPTYWSFLTHAFPDYDERTAFLRLLGTAMYGSNIKIVAAMIGEPNAGKDTVINWLSYLMPGQVASLPFSAFTPHGDDDRGFAPLMGSRVATVSGEVGEGRGAKLLAEKIKTVSSGGGTLRVAEKYEKPTTIWFDGMLFLQGNSVPTIQGGDKALYTNRLVAVEFKYPFKLQARSYESLYRSEAADFAQILFIHYMRAEFKGGGMAGINPPESWRNFAREFADTANPHGFIEACIVPSNDPIPTQQFHQALSAMVAKFGSPYPVGANFWPKRIKSLGFHFKGDHSVRKQVMKQNERQLCYYLKVDADNSDGMFSQRDWNNVLQDSAVNT